MGENTSLSPGGTLLLHHRLLGRLSRRNVERGPSAVVPRTYLGRGLRRQPPIAPNVCTQRESGWFPKEIKGKSSSQVRIPALGEREECSFFLNSTASWRKGGAGVSRVKGNSITPRTHIRGSSGMGGLSSGGGTLHSLKGDSSQKKRVIQREGETTDLVERKGDYSS